MWHRTDEEAIIKVASAIGTPIYIYDLATFRKTIMGIRAAFNVERFVLLFATMANTEPMILKFLAKEGVGACVNSISHLEAVLAAGIDPSRVQFSSTSLSVQDMTRISQAGVRTNLDSPNQVAQWLELTGEKTFGIRLNAAALVGRSSGDRIGIDPTQLASIQEIAQRKNGRLTGLHVYVGTNCMRPDNMVPTINRLLEIANTIPSLQYINIGGGVGVPYSPTDTEFDLHEYGRKVCEAFESIRRERDDDVTLYFEPGRSLAAQSGVFVATVTDIKRLHGSTYIGTDGSIAVFPRPFHHPDSPHAIRLLRSPASCDLMDAAIVGQTTFSRDILGHCKVPVDIDVGDLLLFENSGAYCASMRSNFLGQPEAKVAFVGTQ